MLHVTLMAKFKTTAQLIALGLAIVTPLTPQVWMIGEATIAAFWIAAFLTVSTGWDYFSKAMAYSTGDEDD